MKCLMLNSFPPNIFSDDQCNVLLFIFDSSNKLLGEIFSPCLKGLCHGFLASPWSAKICLCRWKLKNNGPVLLMIAISVH